MTPGVPAGITLSPRQQQRATQLAQKRGLHNCTFRVMDALNMELPGDHFDLVWACESGEHMPDKQRYVEEMMRVLAPGLTLRSAAVLPGKDLLQRQCKAASMYGDLETPSHLALPEHSKHVCCHAHLWDIVSMTADGRAV